MGSRYCRLNNALIDHTADRNTEVSGRSDRPGVTVEHSAGYSNGYQGDTIPCPRFRLHVRYVVGNGSRLNEERSSHLRIRASPTQKHQNLDLA
jgi:hypothetical protein